MSVGKHPHSTSRGLTNAELQVLTLEHAVQKKSLKMWLFLHIRTNVKGCLTSKHSFSLEIKSSSLEASSGWRACRAKRNTHHYSDITGTKSACTAEGGERACNFGGSCAPAGLMHIH